MAGRWLGSVGAGLLLAACASVSSPTPMETQRPLSYPERVELVVTCVRLQGIDAESYEGFGVTVRYSGAVQEERATRVEGRCWEYVDDRHPPPAPLSLAEQYDYMLDVADCLRALGYQVPPAPSADVYVEEMSGDTPPQPFWDPYATLSRQGVNTWEIQRESCPPYPWAR